MTTLYVDNIAPNLASSVAIPNNFISLDKNGNQAMSSGSEAKITGFTVVDNDGLTWDATNNKIVVNQAGNYYLNFQIQFYADANNLGDVRARIFQNGSHVFGSYLMIVGGSTGSDPFDLRHYTTSISSIVTCAVDDEFEFYALCAGTTLSIFAGDSQGERATNISMFKVGAA